jgi:Cell division protein CrgA
VPKTKRRKPAPAKPSRYTPPKPKTAKRSPLWVPVTMFTTLGAGMVVILGNYLQLLPGGSVRNSYLFLGLGLLVGGFVLSTQLR